MIGFRRRSWLVPALSLSCFLFAFFSMAKSEPRKTTGKRVPWTTSKIVGTPEPPLPYVAQRVFPNLTFRDPVFMVRAPGSKRWFVGERGGKIFSFLNDADIAKADLFADLPKEIKSWGTESKFKQVEACFALVFHPQFEKNRFCYVCYIIQSQKGGEQHPEGSRISRFKVSDTNPPRLEPASETVMLSFLAGGHNGCDLHFGNDGFLYISTGDAAAPNPPDPLNTGQDISDLLSSVLRIDVDRTDAGKNYAIPKDNPFINTPKARPEVYAYGFRNPWRMSFDRATGDLWVGDVGWELWEMVYRVQKGGNYGWPIKEGRQEVRPDSPRGPTPILPPTLDFPHTEAASITGGFVYHGRRFPELQGAYICGDWVTRKIWATKFDKDSVLWHKEIAQTDARLVAFGEDDDGELTLVNYDEKGGLSTLIPNPAAKNYRDSFPRKLSETGLFTSTKTHRLAAGVQPYSINEQQWIDHAIAERFFAFPGDEPAKLFDNYVRPKNEFYGSYLYAPTNAVLAKTISIETKRGAPESRRRLETQILHFDGIQWRGYTYAWNNNQTDADLVEAMGKSIPLVIDDCDAPEGQRHQTWRLPSRTECLTCHNSWAGNALAFTVSQLNVKSVASKGSNQLRDLQDMGYFTLLHEDNHKEMPRTSLPPEPLRDLDQKARAYLDVNCSHCHQAGAGGSADLELRASFPLEKTKTLGVRPVQGNFELPNAGIITPSDPFRSTLYYRMAKLGRGRMPHMGSEIVDERGLNLIHDWIRQMPANHDAWLLIEKLVSLDEPGAARRDQDETESALARLALNVAKEKGRKTPTPEDQAIAQGRWTQQLRDKAKSRVAQRVGVVRQLLVLPSSSLMLMRELEAHRLGQVTRTEAIQVALADPNPHIRDLFDRFAPANQRLARLGTEIAPEKLLALTGNTERGRDLFFSPTFQCGSCHQVAGKGGQVGPALDDVAKKLTKAQMIESLLQPSKTIDPKYLTYAVETAAGQVHTGLLVEKAEKQVVLRIVGDKEVRVPVTEMVSMHTLKTSLMPEHLLRDATEPQAGDLLMFLQSLTEAKTR